ncbi:MAG: hypothetical protein KDI19_09115 [Pseudomonadales bacterium]|nr:hypothetical protein [Pseudomonadales bacterium]
MSTQSTALPGHFHESRATVVLVDIRRMIGIIEELGSEHRYVLFLEDFYSLCHDAIEVSGGAVIKYIGDSCLATFGEDDIVHAVDAVKAIRDGFPALCEKYGVHTTGVRANIVIDEVISGEFGPTRQRDIMGKAVGAVMVMEGSGISLSESAYRKLPSANRSGWRKQGGKVVYVMK